MSPSEILELLPREKKHFKAAEPESEGMYLHLLELLCQTSGAKAAQCRAANNEIEGAYYQGQCDAYRAAYRHYLELTR